MRVFYYSATEFYTILFLAPGLKFRPAPDPTFVPGQKIRPAPTQQIGRIDSDRVFFGRVGSGSSDRVAHYQIYPIRYLDPGLMPIRPVSLTNIAMDLIQ